MKMFESYLVREFAMKHGLIEIPLYEEVKTGRGKRLELMKVSLSELEK